MNGRGAYGAEKQDKGMANALGRDMEWDSEILSRYSERCAIKTYKLFISVIFHLIFSSHEKTKKAKPQITGDNCKPLF